MTATTDLPTLARSLVTQFIRHDLDEARFQHMLEQLPGAAFFVQPQKNICLAVNGQAVALTERTRSELLGCPLSTLFPTSGTGSEAPAPFGALQPGRVRQAAAVALRTRSGRTLLVDLKLSAYVEPLLNDMVLLILATPAQERLAEKREKEFQQHAFECINQLLRLFAAPVPDNLKLAVALTRDMAAADAAGLYRVASHQPGLTLTTLEPTSAANFPAALGPSEGQALTLPLSWSSNQRPETLLCQTARTLGWSHLYACPVGEPPAIIGALFVAYRPGNPPASQVNPCLSLAARQIYYLTEQITRETRLTDTHQLAVRLSSQLGAINAQIDEGILILNRLGGLDEANHAAARMLGYRPEDIIGLPYADVLITDDGLAAALQNHLSSGLPAALEGKLHRRHGDVFPVMLRLQPLPESGCVITLRDLSSERSTEVRREYLDNLTYVGQSTQAFAHEVRAPLNNISMGVQFIAARLKDTDETVQQAIDKVQTECSRLSTLMNDMLAWAKPIEPQLEPTDLTALLKRLLQRWSHKTQQRNIRVNFVAEPDCPLAPTDVRLIERVCVNLIDNALQAMPAGGDLSVRLRSLVRGAQERVVEVQVGDSGPGVPEEIRKRIFDPYFTTKLDGTGLGLAICKRLVTVHHGAISVESYPGTGTIFTVTLPALPPASEPARETP